MASPHLQYLVREVRYPISKSAAAVALDKLADYAHRLEVQRGADNERLDRQEAELDRLTSARRWHSDG